MTPNQLARRFPGAAPPHPITVRLAGARAPGMRSRALAHRFLRHVVTANAVSSLIAAVPAAVVPGTVADLLGTNATAAVRVIGIGLLGWVAVLWWMLAGARERVHRLTPWIIAGDATWVVASFVVVIAGALSARGAALVIVQAVVVALFACGQWHWLRGSSGTKAAAASAVASIP